MRLARTRTGLSDILMSFKIAKVANFWGYGIGDLAGQKLVRTKMAKMATFYPFGIGRLDSA